MFRSTVFCSSSSSMIASDTWKVNRKHKWAHIFVCFSCNAVMFSQGSNSTAQAGCTVSCRLYIPKIKIRFSPAKGHGLHGETCILKSQRRWRRQKTENTAHAMKLHLTVFSVFIDFWNNAHSSSILSLYSTSRTWKISNECENRADLHRIDKQLAELKLITSW